MGVLLIAYMLAFPAAGPNQPIQGLGLQNVFDRTGGEGAISAISCSVSPDVPIAGGTASRS
jgi:hypothetical protein